MHFINDKLWVFTSTIDQNNRVMIKEFNQQGNYQKTIYLNLPQINSVNDLEDKRILIKHNHLYTIETDKDENPILVKYKIKSPK